MNISENNNSASQQATNPIVVFRDNPDKRGRKKFFQCPYCGHNHHSQKQVYSHIKNRCKSRKQKKYFTKIQVQNNQKAEQMIQKEKNQLNQVQLVEQFSYGVGDELKFRIQKLEQDVCFMKQSKYLNEVQKSKFSEIFSKQVFQNIGQIVLFNLKSKFKASVQKALLAGLNLNHQKSSIQMNLIDKINQTSLNQIFFDFQTKLLDAHKQLQKRCCLKSKSITRTFKNNEKCFSFLKQFTSFHFQFQTSLISELLNQTSFRRREVRRYFNLLRESDTFFAKYPKIVRFEPTIRRQRKNLQIQTVVNEVSRLYDMGQRQLAIDIWTCCVVGLRASQLLRIYFQTQAGFAKSVKIRQQKNDFQCTRYIPQSLIILLMDSKIKFPMSSQRFKKCRKYCLSTFHSFYGLRSLCVTLITSALAKNHEYGRFHTTSSTTNRYYINSNDQKLIDNVFRLSFKNSGSTQYIQRTFLLDLTQKKPKQIVLKLLNDFQITLNQNSIINQCIDMDQIMLTQTKSLDFTDKKINSNEKIRINSMIYAFNHYQTQLSEKSYSRIQLAIKPSAEDSDIYDEILFDTLAEKGENIEDFNVIQAISQLYSTKINFLDFSNNCQKPQTTQIRDSISKSEITIIKTQKQNYQSSQDEIIQISDKKKSDFLQNKKDFEQKSKPSYLYLTNQSPKCVFNKRCGFMQSIKIKGKFMTRCGICLNEITDDQTQFDGRTLNKQFMTIQFKSKQTLKFKHKSLRNTNNENNLLQKIKQLYGSQAYICQSRYQKDFPLGVKTNYLKFSEQLCQQIKYNRKNEMFLPLCIRNSIIQKAGLGIFAQQDLQKDKIVLSYVGLIATTFSLSPEDHSSLFSLGWIWDKIPKQIMIHPAKILNAARFINSSNEQYKSNCGIKIGFLQNQLTVYIYTLKKIKKKQELLYSYGKSYWDVLENQKSESQQDIDEQSEDL